MVSTRTFAIGSAAAVSVALAAGYAVTMRQADQFSNCRTGVVAGADAIGGPFTLTDQDGRTVTDKDVLNGPSLVYFGYTYCPDVCPTDMARNAEAVDILEKAGFPVTPVFISVDPDRDTPAVLKEWTKYLHPRMIGLTGTSAQIDAVVKAYRTVYQLPSDRSGDGYLVAHMTQTYLMLPNYGFANFFPREISAADMAKSTLCFLKASA
jgi:protein SCO1